MGCDSSPVGIPTHGTLVTIFRHRSPIFNSVLVEQLLHPGRIPRNGCLESSGCTEATYENQSDNKTHCLVLPYLVLLCKAQIV